MQLIVLSSDTQMNITITWLNARDLKQKQYVLLGIYTKQVCDRRPELQEKPWLTCVEFSPDVPSWHLVQKKFIWPMQPKINLEYRVHKNSGKMLTKI